MSSNAESSSSGVSRMSSNAESSSSGVSRKKVWTKARGIYRRYLGKADKEKEKTEEDTVCRPWSIKSKHVERLRLKNIGTWRSRINPHRPDTEFEFDVKLNVHLEASRPISQKKNGEKCVCVSVKIDSVRCSSGALYNSSNGERGNEDGKYGTFCSVLKVRLIPDTSCRDVKALPLKSTANPGWIVKNNQRTTGKVTATMSSNPAINVECTLIDQVSVLVEQQLWRHELVNEGHIGFFWECEGLTKQKKGCMSHFLTKPTLRELESLEASPWNKWNNQGTSLGDVNFSSESHPYRIEWNFVGTLRGKEVKWTMEIELKLLVLRKRDKSGPPTIVKEVLIRRTFSFDDSLVVARRN